MESVTLTVALVAATLVFFLRPVHGLIVCIVALAWYPSYLSVPVGTIDFTVYRIVILAIFANLVLRKDFPGRFKFVWLDKLVVLYFAAQVVAGLTTAHSLRAFLENRAGAVFDMVLPYFVVRTIVTDKQKYLTMLKAILVIASPLAIVGFYQCVTLHNPVGFLRSYYAWAARDWVPVSRFGLMRADVVFTHPIMYGLFFAIFGPICAGILGHAKGDKTLLYVGLGLMCLGLFSCLSSGPALAALFAIAFIAFYRMRRHWKTATITAILMCGFIEVTSNRHFYDVIDRFTLNSATAWYRSRLIEVALYEGGMSGHWVTGFGYDVDPGWSASIDMRDRTDMVNHYLFVLARFGLVGFVPFVAMGVAAVKRLIYAYRGSFLDADKWLIWCLGGAFFGLAAAFVSVSLHGQITTVFYMMLAFCGVMPAVVTSPKLVLTYPETLMTPAMAGEEA